MFISVAVQLTHLLIVEITKTVLSALALLNLLAESL